MDEDVLQEQMQEQDQDQDQVHEQVQVKEQEHEHKPGEVWDHDPGKSVDEPDDGDADEGEPPEPEDEEVLLVEQVVGEDAEVVGAVDGAGGCADTDVAGNLERDGEAMVLKNHS